MKKLVFLSLCFAVASVFCSCSKNTSAVTSSNGTDSVANSQNMMNSTSGVITEETSLNIIAVVTPQGDTMRINKGNAVIEGSGVIVGDSAVVYYFFEAVSDSTGNKPVASRIVTKTAKNKKQ